jgi:putative ABC transport system permease protein
MEAVRDFRQAFRTLARTPGFSLVIIVTLALGIGANSAIFSVVNAVILRPLPYPKPEQLVHISSQFSAQGYRQFWVSPPEFLELQDRARSFSSIGAYRIDQVNLTTPDRPRRASAARVSSELLPTLGVRPLYGRWFDRAETRPNGGDVAMLAYGVWRSAFGGDPGVVGRTVEIMGVPRMIVGIMPADFDVMDGHVEVFLPLALDPVATNRGNHYLYLIGRLREGAVIQSATAELETLLAAWPSTVAPISPNQGVHTPNTGSHRLRFDDLQTQLVGSARTAVLVLQGAVVLVLLIACANVASLLLARAESRHREFAVKSALGAPRWQLLRGFVVEGLVLAVAGAAIGLGLGVAGVRALIAAFPGSIPRATQIALDPPVLAFTLAVAVASAMAFGLAPLLHLSPAATAAALREGGQRSTGGASNRVRRTLVAAEVALAVALAIGAGLLLRTVVNITRVDGGFDRSRMLTFGVSLPQAKYTNARLVQAFFDRLMNDLRGMAGVQTVAAMTGLPPLRDVNANDTLIEGYVPAPGGPAQNVTYYQTVTSGYVATMGIPVVEGRDFQPSDALGPPVVLINETMAQTFYGQQSPVGRRVQPALPGVQAWYTIVGVLKDVKQGGVDRKSGTELYFDMEQFPRLVPGGMPYTMNIVVRTPLPAVSLAGPIERAVAALDPALPVVRLRAMDDVFGEAIGRPRLLAELLGIFAALAVTLAAVGSYGVLSYMVTERRREIGIRMALGAERNTVLRMVLSEGLRLTVFGILAGLGLAFAANRVVASLLFGVGPSDPATMAAVVALMIGVAALGCYLPALLATRVDPMIVLRED